jgi:hypothetical protein
MGAAYIFLLIHGDYLFFYVMMTKWSHLLWRGRLLVTHPYSSFICYSCRWYTNRRTVGTSWSETTRPTLLFSSHLANFSSLAHRPRFSPYLARRQPGGDMYFFCAHSMGEKPGGASFFSCVAYGGVVLSFFPRPFRTMSWHAYIGRC